MPGEEEVLDYFKTCNNWGRWGPDDELGTLNYITPETRRAAFESVREGISVSCARLIPTRQPEADFQWPPMHFMTSSGEGWAGKPTPLDALQVTGDFIGMVFHGFAVTHVDSLCHIARDGQLYNGRPCELVTAASGATVLGVDTVRDGIVGRGVLLDIPFLTGREWLDAEDAVYPDDLSSAEMLAGLEVRAGDIVLCRFGTMARRAALGPSAEVFTSRPGLHASCVPWQHQRQVAALGSDGAQDLFPSGYPSLRAPLHQVGIVSMGLTLIDNCDLEALASTCRNLKRWEFMITVAPLRIENGTGSPVNPIAVF
ncbi:MAG TPA: cyclase family protein [Acidimicrobiales bacterium]|nr:cyclase family protein [Acidimicrobiales bacterium]